MQWRSCPPNKSAGLVFPIVITLHATGSQIHLLSIFMQKCNTLDYLLGVHTIYCFLCTFWLPETCVNSEIKFRLIPWACPIFWEQFLTWVFCISMNIAFICKGQGLVWSPSIYLRSLAGEGLPAAVVVFFSSFLYKGTSNLSGGGALESMNGIECNLDLICSIQRLSQFDEHAIRHSHMLPSHYSPFPPTSQNDYGILLWVCLCMDVPWKHPKYFKLLVIILIQGLEQLNTIFAFKCN